MLLYQKISEILDKSPRKHQWLKFLFNQSVMAKFKPPVRRTVYIEYHFKMKK